MKKFITISNCGLLLNVLGSVFIAFAISTPPVKNLPGWLDFASGEQFNFVTLNHPLWIYIGFILLILGFFLQLKRTS